MAPVTRGATVADDATLAQRHACLRRANGRCAAQRKNAGRNGRDVTQVLTVTCRNATRRAA
eukprot:scaffold23684_cov69-Phaeocystis_antarctica.AAC.1